MHSIIYIIHADYCITRVLHVSDIHSISGVGFDSRRRKVTAGHIERGRALIIRIQVIRSIGPVIWDGELCTGATRASARASHRQSGIGTLSYLMLVFHCLSHLTMTLKWGLRAIGLNGSERLIRVATNAWFSNQIRLRFKKNLGAINDVTTLRGEISSLNVIVAISYST